MDPPEVLAQGIAHVPEGRQLFCDMTVMENLEQGAFSREAKQKTVCNLCKVFEVGPVWEELKKQAAALVRRDTDCGDCSGANAMPKCICL